MIRSACALRVLGLPHRESSDRSSALPLFVGYQGAASTSNHLNIPLWEVVAISSADERICAKTLIGDVSGDNRRSRLSLFTLRAFATWSGTTRVSMKREVAGIECSMDVCSITA